MIMIIINLKGEKFVMKYLLKGNILLLLLILLTIISLFIGVSELSIKDLLHLTESQRNIFILKPNTKDDEYFNCWKFVGFSRLDNATNDAK